jgi:hypothetical protein
MIFLLRLPVRAFSVDGITAAAVPELRCDATRSMPCFVPACLPETRYRLPDPVHEAWQVSVDTTLAAAGVCAPGFSQSISPLPQAQEWGSACTGRAASPRAGCGGGESTLSAHPGTAGNTCDCPVDAFPGLSVLSALVGAGVGGEKGQGSQLACCRW